MLIYAESSISFEDLNLKLADNVGQAYNGVALELFEGRSREKLQLKKDEIITTKDTKKSSLKFSEKSGLEIDLNLISEDDFLQINIDLHNTGTQERLLEVSYALLLKISDARWWDGRFYSDLGIDQLTYERSQLRLPLGVVHNEQVGYALGLDPEQLFSVFANSAENIADNQVKIAFRIKLALVQGQKLNIPLIAYSFTPKFEYLDAVQKYYAFFPKYFNIHPAVSPEIIGTGGYLFSGTDARVLQYEEARRYGMTWEWAYCPAQRPGDWYPDERFWQDEVGYGKEEAHSNIGPGTLEEFRNEMRDRFHKGRPMIASAYYILPITAEREYMKHFQDGIILNEKGEQQFGPSKGWVKKPFALYYTYPWNNSYGVELRKEMRQIVDDFKVRAIAFDEANRMDTQFGTGVENESAAAWFNKKKFVSAQVGLARLADDIHSINSDDFGVAVVMNKPWSYCTATRSDIAMHEWHSYMLEDCFWSLRMLMGHKPISWWKEHEAEFILNWEEMTPEEIVQGIRGVTAFTRLKSLRYGVFTTNLKTVGFKELFYLSRKMGMLMRNGGWQPVPAATCADQKIWLSRYGKELNTFLVAANASRNPRKVKLDIDNSYFAAGEVLFAAYDGHRLETLAVEGGLQVDLGLLQSFEDKIIRSLAEFSLSKGRLLKGNAEFSVDHQSGKLFLEWQLEQENPEGSINIYLPPRYSELKAAINGLDVSLSEKNHSVVFLGKIPQHGKMLLSFVPETKISGDLEKILSFPFVTDARPSASIVMSSDAVEEDKISALRIVAFFDWYHRRMQSPIGTCKSLTRKGMREVKIPIISTEQKSAYTHKIVFTEQTNNSEISLSNDGLTLTIAGKTPESRKKAVLKLLEILEEKYEFFGVLPNRPIYKKANLNGKNFE